MRKDCPHCKNNRLTITTLGLLKKAYPHTEEEKLRRIKYFCEGCQNFLDEGLKIV